MITTHVREVAQSKGYKNAHRLALALGIADNAAGRLWSGEFARIDLPTLDKLCRVLKVAPGKLIRYSVNNERGHDNGNA